MKTMKADELKKLRENTGLDLRKFGELLGLSAATVWRKETGKSKIKKLEAEAIQRIIDERL